MPPACQGRGDIEGTEDSGQGLAGVKVRGLRGHGSGGGGEGEGGGGSSIYAAVLTTAQARRTMQADEQQGGQWPSASDEAT